MVCFIFFNLLCLLIYITKSVVYSTLVHSHTGVVSDIFLNVQGVVQKFENSQCSIEIPTAFIQTKTLSNGLNINHTLIKFVNIA